MTKEQEREELHRTIWQIANDLRGSVDGWDFKSYVLGMLFYRFISENLTLYINKEEQRTGNANFDYTKISDKDAEFGRTDTVKEKGFYNNIMGTSAVFSIFCDSIRFDKEKMEFTYYGRQRIERRTSILTRELVTAGQLKQVPRTDNNPHGLLVVNWRTLLNKDIEQKSKSNF